MKLTTQQLIRLSEEYGRIMTLAEMEQYPIELGYMAEILYELGKITENQDINLEDVERIYGEIISPIFN